MNPDWLTIAFSGLVSISGGGGVVAFFLLRQQRAKLTSESEKLSSEGRKINVEGDVLMSDKALAMYEAMRVEAHEAKQAAEVATLKASNCIAGTYELIDHIYVLRNLMREHQIEPPPFRFPTSLTMIRGDG
jgi:hypothetical protein